MNIVPDQDTSEFLSHHGVMGMKWGHRSATTSAGALTPRQQDKALNRAHATKTSSETIAKSKLEKNPIIAARMRTYSGANKTRVTDAKAQYKAEKATIGSKAAKQKLRGVKREVRDDWDKSQQLADGAELFESLMADIGGRSSSFAMDLQFRNIKKYRV